MSPKEQGIHPTFCIQGYTFALTAASTKNYSKRLLATFSQACFRLHKVIKCAAELKPVLICITIVVLNILSTRIVKTEMNMMRFTVFNLYNMKVHEESYFVARSIDFDVNIIIEKCQTKLA